MGEQGGVGCAGGLSFFPNDTACRADFDGLVDFSLGILIQFNNLNIARPLVPPENSGAHDHAAFAFGTAPQIERRDFHGLAPLLRPALPGSEKIQVIGDRRHLP